MAHEGPIQERITGNKSHCNVSLNIRLRLLSHKPAACYRLIKEPPIPALRTVHFKLRGLCINFLAGRVREGKGWMSADQSCEFQTKSSTSAATAREVHSQRGVNSKRGPRFFLPTPPFLSPRDTLLHRKPVRCRKSGKAR